MSDDSIAVQDIKWTYSSWKVFKTCARQYQHKYVLRDIEFVQNEAGRYGDMVHKAIENFLLHGEVMPPQFQRYEPMVRPVIAWKGEQFCEMKLAVDKNLQPCDYYGDYWVRGKADYVKVRLEKKRAKVLDWKTSKSATYADVKQNELMACLLFMKYPELEQIDTVLCFLVVDKPISATFYRRDLAAMWKRWQYEAHTIQIAVARNNFGPNPSGLCKQWCDVMTCEFNERTTA